MADVEDRPGCVHVRAMLRRDATALVIVVATMFAVAVRSPLHARTEGDSVIEGSCQYSEPVTRQASETTLILCDTATISRGPQSPALDFGQREWGSMARFTGDFADGRLTVSQITLRDGTPRAATGTCEIFYRDDGAFSRISCLARTGSRWIAANFVPSRL